MASVDPSAPLAAVALTRYLQTTCAPLLGESPALLEAFARDLTLPSSAAVVEQFASDPAVRVLQVHAFRVDEPGGDPESNPTTAYRLRVNLGIEYVAASKQRGHDIVCFLKRSGAPVASDVPLTQQLQVMTLGLGKKSVSTKTGEASSGNTTEDDDDDKGDQDDDLLSVVYNYVHESFGPLVNEYSRFHQPQAEVTNLNESARGLPAIRRRMKELELALLQYQQNIEIPEVNLVFHPVIQHAADLVREKGILIDNIEALGLEEKVNDVTFLNDIQGGVNKWIKEIQKVTRLISEPLPGTTTQEINFWCDLHRALLAAQGKLNSPEVEITLAVLKRAKRYLATMTFSSDHGLGPALQRVSSVMALMKDFPMNSILSATDISQLTQDVVAVFTHLKKIRVADEYKLSRLLHLVEVMSSDLTEQIVSLLRGYNLIQMPFDQFESLIAQCKELFSTWHRQVAALYELTKELSKRRGTMNTDKPPLLSELQMEHSSVEERLLEVHEFREQHEKLRQVIERVLGNALDARSDVSDDALVEINAAYAQFSGINPLAVSGEGTAAWKNLRKAYDLCIDRVEGRIITSLTKRLSATTNADEMFRVFSKYNALFFRPRIRSAVQQFQMQLIENVKEDVSILQAKFRAHYALSEASRMSKLRDIPPIAGAVMWAKQIERKLKMLLQRVESVLGAGWEQHVEGKALKVAAEAFMAKLNPQLIFDQWVNELASMPIFDIKNIILNIVTEDTPQGERKKLVVAFNQQIVTLFKEVRNLEWLGYRVPFTLKMIAEDAKSKYPYATSLDASLKAYVSSCHRIQPVFEPLAASFVRDVRATIGKTFSKGNEMRWHADGLAEYVTDLATKVERLQDKVEELLVKTSDIEELFDSIRSAKDAKPDFIKATLQKAQGLVDELNLAGYANLSVFVKNLNDSVSKLLSNKLEALLQAWIACFLKQSDEKAFQGALEVVGIKLTTHQILLKNQVLYLEPSIDDARAQWIQQLQSLINSICDLPKLQASSYENVYGRSTMTLHSPARRPSSARRRDLSFKEIIALLPQGLIVQAFTVVDASISEVEEYVASWLQYQALWDMDAQTAINSVGDDLEKWQQILMEIKNERNSFDAVHNMKRCGPIAINYQQVQAQVNVKYDAWHNEFLSHFGELLCNQINGFYTTISTKRALLEQHALEAATSQVVAAITLIQEMRMMRPTWQGSMESFSQGERLLKKQRFKFSADWPSLPNVEGEWDAFVQLLERKSAAMEGQLPQLQAKILEEKSALDQKISKTVAEWDGSKPLQGGQSPTAAIEVLMVFDTRFKLLRQEQEKISAALDAMSISAAGAGPSLSGDRSSSSALYRVTEELAGLDEVWKCIAKSWSQVDELHDTLWSAVQPRKLRKQLEDIVEEMRRFPARVQQYEAFEHSLANLQAKKSMNSLLSELKSDAIRDRHWKQILKLLRINSAFSELTLRHFWESRISANDQELKHIIRTAQGEMALDEFLRQVSDYWSNFQLDLVNYQNRCRIIRGWDEMFAKLEEHVNSLSSMKQSPYYRVFAEQAGAWEDKLTRIRGILDFWIDVQRRWVYLEGIFFGSADIKQQLPKEFTRFQSIDSEFTSTMKRVAHNPLIVEVANIPNLYHSLERQQDMMGNVQRALGEYLERQRSAFPRFYFVGDEDLLEMIGNSKEPLQIQRHLSKMFAGIVSLEMDPASNNTTIVGMASREGEVVTFKQPVKTSDDTRINVWLGKVEDQMRQTLSSLLEDAVRSYPSDSNPDWYLKWVAEFPAQVVILATQVHWSRSVESALKTGSGNDLDVVLQSIDKVLRILSERVLVDLKNDVRKKYEQLVTELVHQKSVTRRLVQAGVVNADDFRWLYHMRYYFYPSESDPLKKLSIKISNASFSYGFEYLGVGERLVQTPLTERCYLTLTQALDFGMGGNPFGPAGTGKTESVKALGSQLGRFVLVFNCDENFDFQAMGRIFVGLCQVGAWGCFDEFNRLEERVLSAVSQQILSIQTGVSTLKKNSEQGSSSASPSTSIELLGKSVRVHPDVGIFVTMNPGYAGRSNLPDNLKQLFRSIAMVAPDRELIAEVMLFSQGITIAEQISSKVVLLFNLCEDQLSKQPHYDFGLRALKSVLVSAGQLKRKLTKDRDDVSDRGILEQLETKALIGSISDTILPKLVAHDVAVFETLLKGVFPGTEMPVVEEDALRSRIVQLAEERGLVAHKSWVEKALQLYQVMQLRHGVMLVGPSGTGKSSAWRILLDSLEAVDGKKGEAHVIDPKALSKEHLYGVLDNTTLEWSDGVFTHLLRQVLNSVRGESEKRHWIVFDGDVDPEWAENLNSVLDDNRLLTLPSGERLEIPPNVWIMMETETLRYATLATVSRCGMVWFSSETVHTKHIVEYYLKSIATVSRLGAFSLQPTDMEQLRKTAKVYVESVRSLIYPSGAMSEEPSIIETCLNHAVGLVHIMDVTDLRLLMSMFSLLARGLSRIHEYNEGHSDFPMTDDQVRQFTPRWLAFSLVWGFGGSMDFRNRIQLCEFVVQALENRVDFPVSSMTISSENSLLEYEVNVDDAQWRPWVRSVPQLDLESHRVLSTDVVITTVDTLRHVEVLRGWLSQHRPLILCGPPGSGKTMTLTSTISSLPEFEFASLNFSSGTTPDLIMKTFAQYCEYKRTPNGMILSPNAPEKWLVVFCDEVNLPEADAYGTQRVITFLRQLIEQGGFWLGGKNTWVKLQRIQFVGACNPPTDPGRVPLSLRLLRHAPVLLVDFPSYASLKQIYGTFNRALLKLTPSLKSYVQPLTDAMVDVYTSNQRHFTAEMQPHYIYSPRELSRWMRALYEAIEPLEYEIEVETLVKLVFHEALRLFMDRLVTPDEQKWCFQTAKQIMRDHFPQCATVLEALEYGGKNSVLFSTWLSKYYTEVSSVDLRKHIEARLRVFNEEELNVQLVVFDSVIDHVLRIDRVLRQPLGHLLLVGESGAGKTVLSRFVSWMNGMSVFQIKLTSNYTLDNFDDDLRVVLKRAGCDGEKICFIFDESNVLDSAFLERMNALLASGEVPGLFEDDDYTSLMHACREAVQRDGVMVENTEDELFRYFTRQVQRNLHVVFTMNPASGDFRNRTNTSPALFNRCVVDWFGTWNDHALAQVAYEFTNSLDLASDDDFMPPAAAEDALTRFVPSHIASGSAYRDSLIASIVQFHHAVLTHMRRLQKRHVKYNHISPRDYLEFIRQFVTLYSEKRAQLEDQQLHLNVGVQKLKATHEQVAELQKQLALKERELKKKDQEANEKLQQMIREQNEAESRKKETVELAADLAARDEEISSRKKVVEADLAEAEPALLDAQASVNSIRKPQLDEIRALARPPAAVKMTLEAVAIMLGETSLEWADLRKFIRRDDFISQVVNFDSEKLTAKQRQVIQVNYVQNADDFEYEKVNRASKACGPLYKWVISQLNYTRILHSIQPLREEVQTLVEKSADLRQRYEQAKATIDALEVRIESYKQEYAALINEAQMITNDMSGVTKKVERSVALLKSLLAESERWEAGSNNFDHQMKTLVGDTLLSSSFLTYVGFLDFQQRKILVQDWKDILDTMGIQTNPQLSFVDYLSRPNQQLEWQTSELPNDQLCHENAIILERFHRFPLIIDPSGQANNFIMRYYALKTSSKITQTSFLDSSFMKVLASAIRFGTALLVHEVENIDPILNPVLNRELYKTGGRVLIRLGGEEIDYSPDFRLFLITRDPSCRFTPDICSRVTFVNFTVTPSSLESQSLSLLMKHEQPEAEEKRNSLLKLQGEYQARLRELEDMLLQQINNVQGDILDDDSVINALEGTKAEAAQISLQVAQTHTTMETVNAATRLYNPLARGASRLYFALEGLSSVHFLYQYSLGYFLGVLTSVLSSGRDSTNDTSSRLRSLSKNLFAVIAGRVSRGLAETDKLMFAMRLAQIYLDLDRETNAAIGQSDNGSNDYPTDDEVDLLLNHSAFLSRVDHAKSRDDLHSLLPAFSKEEFDRLTKLLAVPSFKHVENHLGQNAAAWNAFIKHPAPEKVTPQGWDAAKIEEATNPRRAAFRRVVLVQMLRPDRTIYAAEAFVTAVFGLEFPWRGEIELRKNIEHDTHAARGILLCSTTGFDASAQVDELAAILQKKYSSVSMGSAEGFDAAEKCLNTAIKNGSWLQLRNVHLCPSWLISLEKKLYNSRESVHPNFRLFLTSEIHPNLPVNLLRICDIFVFEAPSGVKSSMIRSLDGVSPERMNKAPTERARLYLLLSWFHAIVQERLRYAPVGWSKTYEFSQSDFRGACDVIDRWVNSVGHNRAHVAPDNIPWTAIRTTLKESVYGGRIDNEFDEQLLDTLLNNIFTPDSYQNSFRLVNDDEDVTIAEGKTKQQFVEWVYQLPSTNPPSWLGLPRSAETMLLTNQGQQMLRNFQTMQDLYGSEDLSSGSEEEAMLLGSAAEKESSIDVLNARPKWVQELDNRVSGWLQDLPSALPSMSRDPARFGEPLYRCLFREVELGTEFLGTVHTLLSTVQAVCQYKIKPTNDVREAMQTLHQNKVPKIWLRLYQVFDELSLPQWIDDFSRRVKQLADLAVSADNAGALLTNSSGVWLGGLFSPEAFVTAVRQHVAAALQCSLDQLHLVADVRPPLSPDQIGCFGVQGLQLEGAVWTPDGFAPSTTIRSNLDLVYLRWVPVAEIESQTAPLRRLPVYSSSRRSRLMFSVSVPADEAQFPHSKWIQRAVAIALWQYVAA